MGVRKLAPQGHAVRGLPPQAAVQAEAGGITLDPAVDVGGAHGGGLPLVVFEPHGLDAQAQGQVAVTHAQHRVHRHGLDVHRAQVVAAHPAGGILRAQAEAREGAHAQEQVVVDLGGGVGVRNGPHVAVAPARVWVPSSCVTRAGLKAMDEGSARRAVMAPPSALPRALNSYMAKPAASAKGAHAATQSIAARRTRNTLPPICMRPEMAVRQPGAHAARNRTTFPRAPMADGCWPPLSTSCSAERQHVETFVPDGKKEGRAARGVARPRGCF